MDPQVELLSMDATQHNVFFAALPDGTMSAGTEGIARDVRRRLRPSAMPIRPEPLHVSLLSVGGFSGSCPPGVIEAAMRAADSVSLAPLEVAFDRVACFSASHGQRAPALTGDGDGVTGFMRLRDALGTRR